jgi:hypothetical protein
MKKNKPLEKHFYVPIANGVILGKRMTTACKQVLLVLELKAGQSRLAKISQKTIANQTGYSLRTVKRAYKHLKQNGRIEECSGGIHLREPYPKENYVQAYEGVVHHPKWYDWQKHVLLFILTQFRGSDSDSGNRRYSLNLRGEKGKSIERYCRVPGATAGTRRKAVRGFVQELEQLGVLKVVERASRGRPAICRISMEALASMPPERRRVRCQTDPRDGDRAIRALVTCGAVRGDKPVREMVTNHADDKDSTKTQPNSPQISKSPLPP